MRRHREDENRKRKGKKSRNSIGIIRAESLIKVTKALCFCREIMRSKRLIEKGF